MRAIKRVLILAPHQDDEVILAGPFLRGMSENGCEISLVFMTNGDYEKEIGAIRLGEALAVARFFGIKEKNVFFMGYANEYAPGGPHIYNAEYGQIVSSQYGGRETFGLPGHEDYRYTRSGYHHSYTREHLSMDLYDLLTEILPDVIFTTDVEIHPDHKAASLFLDEVLGKILRERSDYKPLVLKKPEYSTGWSGPADFDPLHNPPSKLRRTTMVNHHYSQFENPYIRWNTRVRLPIDPYAREPVKRKNIVYRALAMYASQNAAEHFEGLLNSDAVFWARRTDSVTYRAHITASSGNAGFLHDFKIYDSSDIKRKPSPFWCPGESVWRPTPDDWERKITIDLEQETLVKELVIYQEFCGKTEILKSRLVFDRRMTIPVGRLKKRKPTVIRITPVSAKKIEFYIDACSRDDELPGITEIEIYPDKEIRPLFMKLMLQDNFIYESVWDSKNAPGKGKLGVYFLMDNGESVYPALDEFVLTVTDKRGHALEKDKYITKSGYLKGDQKTCIRINARWKKDSRICDDFTIYSKGGYFCHGFLGKR